MYEVSLNDDAVASFFDFPASPQIFFFVLRVVSFFFHLSLVSSSREMRWLYSVLSHVFDDLVGHL